MQDSVNVSFRKKRTVRLKLAFRERDRDLGLGFRSDDVHWGQRGNNNG